MPAVRHVLVVDDSAVARHVLSEVIAAEPDLRVLGTASSPYRAVEIMRRQAPDVIVLDLEMPGMDGLGFLQRIMEQHPLPVVICSGLVGRDDSAVARARELGACAALSRPTLDDTPAGRQSRQALLRAVRTAALPGAPSADDLDRVVPASCAPPRAGGALRPPHASRAPFAGAAPPPLILLGASTGGTEALATVIADLPADSPGVLIVQHMPAAFTGPFAQRLDMLGALRVREAVHGARVEPGLALLAPGGRQMLLQRAGAGYQVAVVDAPPVNRHRPSVDVLFASAARLAGERMVAALLTGMGNDGAAGLRELRDAGARTIAQDEATCVVFGMPREAIRLGAAERVLPLPDIAPALIALLPAASP